MGIFSIVDNRAWRSLQTVANDFQSFAAVSSVAKNRIILDGSQLGADEMYASYSLQNKWMGRIYFFGLTCVKYDDTPAEEVIIKLHYSGSALGGTRSVRLVSKKQHELAERLNNDTDIIEICKSIDFEMLKLAYSRKNNAWTLEIRPNYGDFIWILIPPVRYMRRPKQQELEQTAQLIERIFFHLTRTKG